MVEQGSTVQGAIFIEMEIFHIFIVQYFHKEETTMC